MGQPNPSGVGIRYGLITSAALVVYSLALQVAGYGNDTTLGYISYAILVVGIYFGHKAFKDLGDGFMSYGQGLSLGSIISAISGVILGISTYFYLKFVDNSVIELAMEEARIKLEQQGMDDEVIDQAMAMTQQFMTPGWLGFFSILGTVIGGFIFSLIIAAFTKKSNPEVEF